FGRHLLELGRVAGGEHHVGAGGGQHFRGERAERAGRAGDDRGLAADVEQRQGILQDVFGHGELVLWSWPARPGPPRLRHARAKAWMPGTRPGMTDLRHFTGATATRMVQTSLPRLTISRLSFDPMTQESFFFSTVSLPPTMTVNSPASTK